MNNPLIVLTPNGLYCPVGDFYIDPARPVARAIITHAHADHARRNCDFYLTTNVGKQLLQERVGQYANISTLAYGEKLAINGVEISLHPAGHILGSAQIRLCYQGKVWVISGDYKLEPDPTCAAFEALPCDVFITEATFGNPIYQWPLQQEVFDQVNAWWRANQTQGKTSILLGYALGKAQRLLAGLDANIGPIYTHGAVEKLTSIYRQEKIALPATIPISHIHHKQVDWPQAIVIAPPSATKTAWIKRFGDYATGFASGWMLKNSWRYQQQFDQGFCLSDHADWPSLLTAVAATGAEQIYVMHTSSQHLVKHLQKQGIYAQPIEALSIENKQLDLLE